jgi:hypothetical protein
VFNTVIAIITLCNVILWSQARNKAVQLRFLDSFPYWEDCAFIDNVRTRDVMIREMKQIAKSAARVTERLTKAEARLAARLRQYIRAQNANDRIATSIEADAILQNLSHLLSLHLEDESGWNSQERWVDGVVGAKLAVSSSGQAKAVGRIVWGLLKDTGGPQWFEPFDAEVIIGGPEGDLERYSLRFGDRDARIPTPVPPGLYSTLADHANIEAMPGVSEWTYEFSKPRN